MIKRVSKNERCPVCGHSKGCGVSDNGEICFCIRVSEGARKHCKNGAALHVLKPSDGTFQPRTYTVQQRKPRNEWKPAVRRWAMETAAVTGLARSLGVSSESLRLLGAGRVCGDELLTLGTKCRPDRQFFTFPMLGITGDLWGVRLRAEDGSKFSMSNGAEGLFVPSGIEPRQPLLITEGASDVAALLTVGFTNVIGRPSATGGARLLQAAVKALKPPEVTIIADNDGHGAGQQGARTLATALSIYCRVIRIAIPPAKDAREWIRAGASMGEIIEHIEQAPLIGRKVVAHAS